MRVGPGKAGGVKQQEGAKGQGAGNASGPVVRVWAGAGSAGSTVQCVQKGTGAWARQASNAGAMGSVLRDARCGLVHC